MKRMTFVWILAALSGLGLTACGQDGKDGAPGESGAQGPGGETGAAGPAGEKGDQGDEGDLGPRGAKGDDGADGEDGVAGPAGADGPQGEEGPQGPIGPQGPAGPEGPAGPAGAGGGGGVDAACLASLPTGAYRTPCDAPHNALLAAPGLQLDYVTRTAGDKVDMFAMWPSDSAPTHLIACIEGGAESLVADGIVAGLDKMNPSVQAINLADGTVTTLLRGMSRCDGIRRTPWGTVLATEEQADGAGYELLLPADPESLATEYHVTDRGAGTIVDDTNSATDAVAKRSALPTMRWEGLGITEGGVVIAGNELRPGSYEKRLRQRRHRRRRTLQVHPR